MNKTFLIIKREFLTRVRKKTFIIGTILFPVLYLALIFGTGYIAENTKERLKFAFEDKSGLFADSLIKAANAADSSNIIQPVVPIDEKFKKSFDSLGYDGYIIIPATFSWQTGADSANPVVLYTKKSFGAGAARPAEKKINDVLNKIKRDSLKIDNARQEILDASLHFKLQNEKNTDEISSTVIGYVCGFLMYLILLLYGSQVMMGVTEEKTNRIAEVVVSSVKPFQLMLGKIIGIAMVALTQFLIWIVCIFLIYNLTKASGTGGAAAGVLGAVQKVFTTVNVPLVVGSFIFYMLGGFFFYSSLYAAIGSAINEDMREAQSLSFPITMLVIFSIALMSPVISNPGSPVAVWASIIPFSSPIVMMCRIPFGVPNTVPLWQLGLSMALLIAGFIFTTWFAAKIYRTGILMYGKKPSWKEMIKWAFRK